MTRRKPKPASNVPRYIPCGKCMNGLVRVQRGSGYVMRQCQCMAEWLGKKKQGVDGKAKGAGEA